MLDRFLLGRGESRVWLTTSLRNALKENVIKLTLHLKFSKYNWLAEVLNGALPGVFDSNPLIFFTDSYKDKKKGKLDVWPLSKILSKSGPIHCCAFLFNVIRILLMSTCIAPHAEAMANITIRQLCEKKMQVVAN